LRFEFTLTEAQSEFLSSEKKFTVVTKGRRFGATIGLAIHVIISLIKGKKVLWVDTINGNIDRYFERYFVPILRQNDIPYEYNVQKKILKIMNGFCDFRSADNPSSIEGFGYDLIILNEAGIILKDEYLYTNAILPMLMDYEGSQLIAAGVPKGKYLKSGREHPFYILYDRGKQGHKDYSVYEYSSYDNPFLREEDVASLEDEMKAMSDLQVQQEIYGKFIEYSGNNPFLYNFNDSMIQDVSLNEHERIIISIDFNINPFCAIVAQSNFVNYLNIIDEISIDNGNIGLMVETIKRKYKPYLRTCLITGDAMGKQRNLGAKDNYSNYDQIQMGLGLNPKQIIVVPNPTHENSRADCNYILAHFPNIAINTKCSGVIRDMKYVQADASGSIVKQNRKVDTQQSDFLDNFRYIVNTFLKEWIRVNQKKVLHLENKGNGKGFTTREQRESIDKAINGFR